MEKECRPCLEYLLIEIWVQAKVHSFPVLLNSNPKLFFPNFKFDQTEKISLLLVLGVHPEKNSMMLTRQYIKEEIELLWWVDLDMHACVRRVSVLSLSYITWCMLLSIPERAYRSLILSWAGFPLQGSDVRGARETNYSGIHLNSENTVLDHQKKRYGTRTAS